MQSLAEQQIQS